MSAMNGTASTHTHAEPRAGAIERGQRWAPKRGGPSCVVKLVGQRLVAMKPDGGDLFTVRPLVLLDQYTLVSSVRATELTPPVTKSAAVAAPTSASTRRRSRRS